MLLRQLPPLLQLRLPTLMLMLTPMLTMLPTLPMPMLMLTPMLTPTPMLLMLQRHQALGDRPTNPSDG